MTISMKNLTKKCQNCGKEYTLNGQYSSAQVTKSKFCSRECQYVGKTKKGGGWNKGKKMPWKKEDKVTPLQEQIRDTFENRQWRSDIFTRDNFTCVLCGQRGYLVADHYPISFRQIFYEYAIKTLQQAVDCAKFWDINNGRTLCKPCHLKTDNYGHKAKREIYG